MCFVRSLASAEPVDGVELRLIARNNEVLATRTTDAQRARRASSRALRAAPAASHQLRSSRRTGDDYGFLDLGAGAVRSHRPRREGPRRAARALDAYRLSRTRRLSLGRDGSHQRAAARRPRRGRGGPAADARRQAPRRRRVPPRHRRGPGTGRTRAVGAASFGRAHRHVARAGLRRSEEPRHRRDDLPRRGLRARTARPHADAARFDARAGRGSAHRNSPRAISTARRARGSKSPARSSCRRRNR